MNFFSDSGSHRSLSENHNGSLSVNSRPSNPVSPERRLDMVLGSSEIQFNNGPGSTGIQFSDHNPGVKQMARPIPTFNSFGIHQVEDSAVGEVHLARPAYAPTPSPGGSDDAPPPLPSRQQNLGQGQQPQSLPYFPYHQFPGRSVKSMCKYFFHFS